MACSRHGLRCSGISVIANYYHILMNFSIFSYLLTMVYIVMVLLRPLVPNTKEARESGLFCA